MTYIPETKALADGRCLVSVALKKQWARSASYWVEVWVVDKKKVQFYYALRRWSFMRRGEAGNERVKGEVPGQRHTTLTSAFMQFQDLTKDKLDQDYVVDTAITRPDLTEQPLTAFEEQIDEWRYPGKELQTKSDGPEVEVVGGKRKKKQKKEEKPKDTFKDAVSRRKKDAMW